MSDNFTFRVIWSEDDSEYVGLCEDFPNLSYLDKSSEKALVGIRNLVAETVADETRKHPFFSSRNDKEDGSYEDVEVTLNHLRGGRFDAV